MNPMNDSDRAKFDSLTEEIEVLKDGIANLTLKFDKVYYAITGNELDGNRGIVYRLNLTEEKASKLEKDMDRIKWTVIGWGVGAGILGGGIMNTVISRLLNP
jgi:hypothetical protein